MPKLREYCTSASLLDFSILSSIGFPVDESFYNAGDVVEVHKELQPYLIVERDLTGGIREHIVMFNPAYSDNLYPISTRIFNKHGILQGTTQMLCPMGIEQALYSAFTEQMTEYDSECKISHIKSILLDSLFCYCAEAEANLEVADAIGGNCETLMNRLVVVAEDDVAHAENYNDLISQIVYKIDEAKGITKNENRYTIPIVLDYLQNVIFNSYKNIYDVDKSGIQYCMDTFNHVSPRKLKLWLKEPIGKYIARCPSKEDLEDIGKKLLEGYEIIKCAKEDGEDSRIRIHDIYSCLTTFKGDSFEINYVKNKKPKSGYTCTIAKAFRPDGRTISGSELGDYPNRLLIAIMTLFSENGSLELMEMDEISVIYLDKICYIKIKGDKKIAFVINMAFASMSSPVLIYT